VPALEINTEIHFFFAYYPPPWVAEQASTEVRESGKIYAICGSARLEDQAERDEPNWPIIEERRAYLERFSTKSGHAA
jgi:hypothetical protein